MYVYTYFHIVWNNSLEIKIHFLCKEVWLKKWRGVPPPRYKKVQFKKKITTYMHLWNFLVWIFQEEALCILYVWCRNGSSQIV